MNEKNKPLPEGLNCIMHLIQPEKVEKTENNEVKEECQNTED